MKRSQPGTVWLEQERKNSVLETKKKIKIKKDRLSVTKILEFMKDKD